MLGIEFATHAIQEETTDFREREETYSAEARLTVYALTAAILLFAFPIGFGLLIFNILGGVNLRTTAHAMALTGMVMALGMSEYAPPLPGICARALKHSLEQSVFLDQLVAQHQPDMSDHRSQQNPPRADMRPFGDIAQRVVLG